MIKPSVTIATLFSVLVFTVSFSVFYQEAQAATGDLVELQKILASDAAANDFFGTSVSISGDRAIVGADDEDEKGSASSNYFRVPFGILALLSFSWDDCSIKQAAENGSITKVGTADYEFFSVLGIYAKTTVHVHSAP